MVTPTEKAFSSHILRAIVLLLGMACLSAPVRAQPSEPLARVTFIETLESNEQSADVIRFVSGASDPAFVGMFLYQGDEVHTGPATTLKLLFLKNVASDDKTAIVDPNSKLIVDTDSSIFAYLGRVFMQFAGFFDIKLSDRTLGTDGTEFQVEVNPDGSVELLVLEGDVGLYPFRLPIGEPSARSEQTEQEAPQDPDATLGSGETVQNRHLISIRNQCQKPHNFTVDGQSSLSWVSLVSETQIELGPNQVRPLPLDIRIDAQGILAGHYQADFFIRCPDCASEPGCGGDLGPIDYQIRINPPLRTSRLQRVLVAVRGSLPQQSQEAQEEEVRAAIERSTRMILKDQPSYADAGLFPAFESAQEREEAFADARFKAFWSRDARAFETMGAIYSEWGRGARALKAYTHASELNASIRENDRFLMRWARANRQAGDLDRAAELISQAAQISPDSPEVLNEQGVLLLDQALRQEELGQIPEASDLAEQAIEVFSRTVQLSGQDEQPEEKRTIAFVNEAEANLALGRLRRQEGDLAGAGRLFGSAQRILERGVTEQTDYPFAPVALGRSYLQMGRLRLAQAQGDSSLRRRAQDDLERAKSQFSRAAQDTPQLASALQGLADVSAAQGNRQEALAYARRAVNANPRYRPAYQTMAELLEEDDPEEAQVYRDVSEKLLSKKDQRDPLLPRLIGLSLEEARGRLAQARLKPGSITYRPSPQQDRSILEHSPSSGTRLRSGQSVNLVVAGPEDPIPTPKVEGMPYAQAVRAIEEAGFKVGTVIEKKSNKPEGSVHDQDPEGGDKRVVGSVIDLEIAVPTDPGKARVPGLEGLDRAGAESRIEEAGFIVGRVSEKESRDRPGTVIDQSPDPGKKRDKGKRVDFVLAVPERIKVPGLGNDQLEEARRKLREKGLTVGRVEQAVSCDSPGRVISQEPEKGTRIPSGDSVNLVVGGLGESPVRTANLTGRSSEEAERMLQEQGLRLGQVDSREDPRNRPGTVLDQSPQAGTLMARGCPVQIVVAQAVPLVTVPNLAGMDFRNAQRTLSLAQLQLGTVDSLESSARAGAVLRQFPSPGIRVRRGSTVNLVIAVPIPLSMPRVTGMLLEQARARLQDSRLQVGRIIDQQAPDLRPGTVINQSPAPGTRVQPGTAVTLYVANRNLDRRPDLAVQIQQTGPQVRRERGIYVPVRITFRNQGQGPAERFKAAFYLSASSASPRLTTVQVGRQEQYYLYTQSALQPGGSQSFEGLLLIPANTHGQTAQLWAEADSCSGDEFMPPHCRVPESNENNNQSNRLSIRLDR